jgi:hypothetical protein
MKSACAIVSLEEKNGQMRCLLRYQFFVHIKPLQMETMLLVTLKYHFNGAVQSLQNDKVYDAPLTLAILFLHFFISLFTWHVQFEYYK